MAGAGRRRRLLGLALLLLLLCAALCAVEGGKKAKNKGKKVSALSRSLCLRLSDSRSPCLVSFTSSARVFLPSHTFRLRMNGA